MPLPALELYLIQVGTSPVLLKDPNSPLQLFSDFCPHPPFPKINLSDTHDSVLRIQLSLLSSHEYGPVFLAVHFLHRHCYRFHSLYTQVLGWLYVPKTVLVHTTLTAGIFGSLYSHQPTWIQSSFPLPLL